MHLSPAIHRLFTTQHGVASVDQLLAALEKGAPAAPRKPADNLALSNNRAKAVVNYLVSKNIPAQRLTAKGYGETKPMADNKSEAGRAINRRTELKVIGK